MVLPLHEVVVLIDPVVSIVLASVLLALRFNDRANRAFALYLLLDASRLGCVVLSRLDAAPGGDVWVRLSLYPSIAGFFSLVYFVSVFPRPRGWLPKRVPPSALFATGAFAVMLLYASDPAAVAVAWSPMDVWDQIARAALWVIPFVLAHDWARDPASPRTRAALWLSLGLIASAAYFWTVGNTGLLVERAPIRAGILLRLAQTGAAVALAAYVASVALRRPGPETRRPAIRYVLTIALALASAALVWFSPQLGLVSSGSAAEAVMRAAALTSWSLVLPVVVTYSLLRFQLFDIDLRLKRTVKTGTVAAAFIVLYVVVTASAQVFLPAAAPYVGAGAALLLLLAIVPLQRLADKVANAAVPTVGAAHGLSETKLDVYRGALEQALSEDGALSRDSAAMLASMRRQLGITERDHAVMEHALRRAGREAQAGLALARGAIVLGRYRVLDELGRGAFGTTYLALDETLRRRVVLKILRAADEGADDMLREAQAIAAVRHPHVVTIYDVERMGDEAMLVMEHAEGGSLAQRLQSGPLPPAEFSGLARDVIAGLAAVHAAGIVHRDVKPSNVLLDKDGKAKIADFGIARAHDADATMGLSSGGPAIGTARYMSPEQARGRKCTPRSDLFSAAATLYEAWTGVPYLEPRADESAVELQLRAAAQREFDRAMRGPPELAAWFAKALHPDATRRFASAEAMSAALPSALTSARRPDANDAPR